ncbi:MAG: type III polyketide synthase [Gemmatimonadota bacterium]|nr:type III polyketide synthase [Gemmatimonadota bacterium]
MTLCLEGFGTALPAHRLTQDEAVALHTTFCRIDSRDARRLRALYRRSGIHTRHSVLLEGSDGPLEERQTFYPPAADDDDGGPSTVRRMAMYEAHAPPLATTAARRALETGAVDPQEVTHLVTVSCTGFISPGVDAKIIEELGLRRDTQRTNVGFMGCHGALNGLRVAASFAGRGEPVVPLVCSVELCTLHFSYGWDPDMLVANALFSDGAAAVVGRAEPNGGGPDRGSSNGSRPWSVAGTGTHLMRDSEDAMTWRIGDHGFRMTLSAQVPGLIESELRPWIVDWLAGFDLTLPDVGSWAVHPGGPRVLASVERALDLDSESTSASREILAECGNMSSATVLFILDRMRAREAPRPCVALAFGPGLVVEATLLT